MISIETDFLPGAEEKLGEAGEKVLVFLWLKRDDESAGKFFRPLVREAIFLIESDSLSPLSDGPIADYLSQQDLGYVREKVGNLR